MKEKNRKPERKKSLALAGVLALAGFAAGGCRTMYEPASERDLKHYSVYESKRMDDYADYANIRNSAIENTREPAVKFMRADRYKALGKYSELAERVQSINNSMIGALAGADAAVLDLYNELNGKEEKFSAKFDESRKKNLEDALSDYDYARIGLIGKSGDENLISYNDLVKLVENSDKEGLGKDIESLVSDFKGNARELSKRVGLEIALDISEGRYGKRMLEKLKLEKSLKKINSGLGKEYDNIAPQVIKKLGIEKTINENLDNFYVHFLGDSAVDGDEVVRNHRWKMVQKIYDAFTGGKISGEELEITLADIDRKIAEIAVKAYSKSNNLESAVKKLIVIAVPGASLATGVRAASHWGVNDCAEDFWAVEAAKRAMRKGEKGKQNSEEKGKDIMDYIMQIRLGATNGDHFVGNKYEVVREGIFDFIVTGGQVVGLYYGINGIGGNGHGGAGEIPPGPGGH